jgi:hypothetical protein
MAAGYKIKQKLGADKTYVRPKVTKTEKLTPDEISKMLEGYKVVEDFTDVPLGTHVRYFIKDKVTGKDLFRTGGFIENKKGLPEYITLANGKIGWPVQLKGATVFVKMSNKEQVTGLQNSYEKKLVKYQAELQKYKKALAERDEIIRKLKTYIKANMAVSVKKK